MALDITQEELRELAILVAPLIKSNATDVGIPHLLIHWTVSVHTGSTPGKRYYQDSSCSHF